MTSGPKDLVLVRLRVCLCSADGHHFLHAGVLRCFGRFRAFRAKNLEAILLLGTAFVILLGRTAAGVFLTDFLPEEGMLANFRLENLTVWIMNNPVTAGNRAIMIGIALGTASVSLKILWAWTAPISVEVTDVRVPA